MTARTYTVKIGDDEVTASPLQLLRMARGLWVAWRLHRQATKAVDLLRVAFVRYDENPERVQLGTLRRRASLPVTGLSQVDGHGDGPAGSGGHWEIQPNPRRPYVPEPEVWW